MDIENLVQIVEHNSIDEANRWLKQNLKMEIMFVQCHFLGETIGILGQNIFKVTVTYKQ